MHTRGGWRGGSGGPTPLTWSGDPRADRWTLRLQTGAASTAPRKPGPLPSPGPCVSRPPRGLLRAGLTDHSSKGAAHWVPAPPETYDSRARDSPSPARVRGNQGTEPAQPSEVTVARGAETPPPPRSGQAWPPGARRGLWAAGPTGLRCGPCWQAAAWRTETLPPSGAPGARVPLPAPTPRAGPESRLGGVQEPPSVLCSPATRPPAPQSLEGSNSCCEGPRGAQRGPGQAGTAGPPGGLQAPHMTRVTPTLLQPPLG